MNNVFGLRHEDKYLMERRIPLTPINVKELIDSGFSVYVEQSPKRIFNDKEFEEVGAIVRDNLKHCPVIIGVKEIPMHHFEENKTYVFFSHVIKGQQYNMPMLKLMMEKKCNLIDYEKITSDDGRRLVFFGYFAGLAGMINSLWSLGQRWKEYGITTPFEKIKQAFRYNSLAEVEKVISEVGEEIAEKGLPQNLAPVVIGFTGYGNVSNGAQHIAGLLPIKEILPDELLSLTSHGQLPNNLIYKVVFKEQDMFEPVEPGKEFDLQEYYKHPERFASKFEQYIPHLTVLENCMYWDARYPRIVTKDYIEQLYSQGTPKLTVIGDITCDPDGSIEFTHKGTEIEDPVFVYNPFTREPTMGFTGDGILVMAVDILPSELPREASEHFGKVLMKFVKEIVQADYQNSGFVDLDLPSPVKRALILLRGKLTPDYEYLEKYLK